LTFAIIAKAFDPGRLEEDKLIKASLPMHCTSDDGALPVKYLSKAWCTGILRVPRSEIGEITVSREARKLNYVFEGYENPVLGRLAACFECLADRFFVVPFCQPLQHIRDYFGEKIGLYFAFLGFYAYSLLFPGLAGLLWTVAMQHGNKSNKDALLAIFAVFLVMWSALFNKFWYQEEKVVALRWGMVDFEGEQPDRPQFEFEKIIPDAVTGEKVKFYSPRRRRQKMLVSGIIMTMAIYLLLSVFSIVFELKYYLMNVKALEGASDIVSMYQAVQITILSTVFEVVARILNDWENHRTEIDHEDSLIFKIFLFEMVNQFGSLLYTTFILEGVYGCRDMNCMGEVEDLLLYIFITRYAMNAVEIGLPYWNYTSGIAEEEANLEELRQKAKEEVQ
jgi:hypothetical protein